MTKTLSSISLLLLSGTALADSGFYIGGGAGGATLESDFADSGIPSLPSGIDEDDTAFKVFGGYTFDLPLIDLSVEAGYVDFGEPDVQTAFGELLIDTTGINAWGIAAVEAGPIDVFGKLGFIAWDVDASLAGFSESDDGTDVGYGIGVGFDLLKIQIRGEYEVYDLDDADLEMLSLSLLYRFN